MEVKIQETPAKAEPAPATVAQETADPPTRMEAKVTPKPPAKAEPKISYTEFLAKHGLPVASKSPNSGITKAPQIKTKGIPDGVVGGSSHSHGGGGGSALTAAQHAALDAYRSRLVTCVSAGTSSQVGQSAVGRLPGNRDWLKTHSARRAETGPDRYDRHGGPAGSQKGL